MVIELFIAFKDYAGVLFGFMLLICASFLLPKKLRKYVLTAGFAVIVFRTLQIFQARKAMKAADIERDRLRALDKALGEKLSKLQERSEGLRSEQRTIEQDIERLQRESEALDDSHENSRAQKKRLDSQTNDLLARAKEAEEERQTQLDALNSAAELARQYSPNWLNESKTP